MSEIINLRRARKWAKRAEAEALAAQNRGTFGRSRYARTSDATTATLAEQRWQAHALTGISRDQDKP